MHCTFLCLLFVNVMSMVVRGLSAHAISKGGTKIHDTQIHAKVVELSKLQISDMCAIVVRPNVRGVASCSTRFACGTGSRT